MQTGIDHRRGIQHPVSHKYSQPAYATLVHQEHQLELLVNVYNIANVFNYIGLVTI